MAQTAPAAPHGAFRVLLAAIALAIWAALLVTVIAPAASPDAVSLWHFRSAAAARGSVLQLLTLAALVAARFAPLGLAAAFLAPDRDSAVVRFFVVGLPAWIVGVGAAIAVVGMRLGAAGPPGPSDVVMPAIGVFVGVVTGMAIRRGPIALLFVPIRLIGWATLLAFVALVVFAAAIQRDPLVPPPDPIDSAAKRHLVSVLRGKDPGRLGAGETQTLKLTQAEADDLVAWVSPLVASPVRFRGAVRFDAGDRLEFRTATRVPRIGRWLNAEASAHVRVDHGALALSAPRFRLGRVAVPAPLMDALAPAIAWALRAERPLRPLFRATHSLRAGNGALAATYGHVDLPDSPVARLLWGGGTGVELREAMAADIKSIVAAMASSPPGDTRFERAYEAAFEKARARTTDGTAVAENRAAVLALGYVLGSERLAGLTGVVADTVTTRDAVALRTHTTAHRRPDWTRHFSLSAAITALSAVAPSDAVGVLKEELDADPSGGSGFSFGDLLADRSGTTFAERATRDEASARALQQRVAAGFRVDDYLPPGADLPEGIADADLRGHWGGVNGARFRSQVAEIDRRIGGLAGYRGN